MASVTRAIRFGLWDFVIVWALLLLCLASCTSSVDLTTPTKRGVVFLFPGWTLPGDSYVQTGTEALAQKIRARGARADINYSTEWATAADRFLAGSPAATSIPIAIVGYSYGAKGAIQFARGLAIAGVKVQTLVVIEAPESEPIPANVRRALHICVPNGNFSRTIMPDRDFAGSLENRAYVLSRGAELDVNHISIIRVEEIHAIVLNEILDAGGVRQRWPVVTSEARPHRRVVPAERQQSVQLGKIDESTPQVRPERRRAVASEGGCRPGESTTGTKIADP